MADYMKTIDPARTVSKTAAPQEPRNPTLPDPLLEKNGKSGYGMVDGTQHPGDQEHEGGDPLGEGDAQYGASPIRRSRYGEDHDVQEGRRRHAKVQPGKHFDTPGQKS